MPIKNSQEPDEDTFNYICETLRQLALELQEDKQEEELFAATSEIQTDLVTEEVAETVEKEQALTGSQPSSVEKSNHGQVRIHLSGLKEREVALMKDELAHLGEIYDVEQTSNSLEASLITSATEDDITAVLCFVVEPEQITFLPTNESQAEAVKTETTTEKKFCSRNYRCRKQDRKQYNKQELSSDKYRNAGKNRCT